MRGQIKERNYTVDFIEFGTGSKIVFAFHGFNNNAGNFSFLEPALGSDYKVIAINLFFHGDSHAEEELVEKGLSEEELKTFFELLCERFPAEKYILIGYSLGGRISLFLSGQFPEKVGHLILIAPDGIRISPFYKLVTQNKPGRRFLKGVVENPAIFFGIGKFLRSFRLINEKRYLFALNNFDSKEKREKVYRVWLIYRNVHVNIDDVRNTIMRHGIRTDMLFGAYDQIIPASIGFKFQMGMEKQIGVHILNSGHRLLNENTGIEIANLLIREKSR